jgi:drug/metabolite transporter (DMT)-like permease
MNDSSRTAPPLRDAQTLLALAAGLAMGHVVRAMAERSAESALAMPSAVVFLVCGCAGVVCALVAVPRPRWVGPRIGRWVAAIGVGLLGALAPPLIF